ncbi:MAG: uracil-DNA glycosylase [Desulfomonile tiedjei]|nr:uracil-DNA glycosylase [Desulfomonile tiedjei]
MAETSQDTIQLVRSYLQWQVNMGFVELILPPAREQSTGRPTLEAIREQLGDCTRCLLSKTRRTIVFGEGNPHARLMFVGEGPGADEDRQGRPFVGKAGQLLTRMIEAMHRDRAEVYIANVVKCRPPGNRNPLREEMDVCFPFLEAQIAAVEPQVIVALGKIAASALLGSNEPISRLRGRFHDRGGIAVMPTYHPSFLLRNETDRGYKAEAWADLQQVMALLGIERTGSGD